MGLVAATWAVIGLCPRDDVALVVFLRWWGFVSKRGWLVRASLPHFPAGVCLVVVRCPRGVWGGTRWGGEGLVVPKGITLPAACSVWKDGDDT